MRRALALLPAGLHRLAYKTAYGPLRAWWRVGHPSARGAAVACWRDDRLLVVRTSYRDALHLPCGSLRRGEDARAGAIRELREEVGLEVAPETLEGPVRLGFVDEGRSIEDSVFEWWPADRPEPVVDGREIVWAGWLSPAELAPRPLTPTLRLYLEHRR